MKSALLFPGQAAQFVHMGKKILEENSDLMGEMQKAVDVLGFDIKTVMTEGSEEDLRQTNVTQPAVFIHSYLMMRSKPEISFDAVAGHSLGEFTALVAAGCLSFEDGLRLVKLRSHLMQEACEATESSMAAVIGLEDSAVEEICDSIDGVVVPANYNCPGQLVISGEIKALEECVEKLKDAGAKRAMLLNVGGAFHSELMSTAAAGLSKAINDLEFRSPICPIYQNVDGRPYSEPEKIKANLVDQLDSPVRWTQTIQNMIADDISYFIEVGGRGNILNGMIRRIDRSVETEAWKE